MDGQVRSVFISDIHLGSKHARTDLLVEFLRWVIEVKPDRLYIVGDFIDGWKLKRNWSWSNECNLVVQKILKVARKGTEICYAAGNHDEFLREFLHPELNLGSIHIKDEFIHEDVQGRNLLVVHGDRFDATIRYAMKSARWLCYLGDLGYDFMISLNSVVNWGRRILGLPYWSLSKAVKHRFKQAVNYVGGFEQILADYAKERHCEGVVCGHIHTPNITQIHGIDYYNCGDWVETCSALVEYRDGRIELHFAHSPSTNHPGAEWEAMTT